MSEGKRSKHSLMSIFMAALGVVVLARLFTLTVTEADKWEAYCEDISVRSLYETAPRGDILDRNGKKLATSRPVRSVSVSRAGMDREEIMESALSVMEILSDMGEDADMTEEGISEAIDDAGYDAYLPVTVSDDISDRAAEAIEAKGLKCVRVSTEYVRYYPGGGLAPHIIGYMGRITEEEEDEYVSGKGYRKDALIGKDGIEKLYEDRLRGEDGISCFQVDSTGRITGLIGESKAKKGEDIKLTIDAGLQRTTEDALEQAVEKAATGGVFESGYGDVQMDYAKNAAVGAAVALDVKSGEVLSIASFPDFDPNDFAVAVSEEKWESLQRENSYDPLSPSPMYNVATMTAVQPGSTFKPVTALAAMSCGLDPGRYLYDNGFVETGGRRYGCFLWNDRREKHGYVDLKEALKVSCNYYFYDIASGMDLASGRHLGYKREITNDTILRFAKALGLGAETGIETGESDGVIPSEHLKTEGIKNSLRNYLLAEEETYFLKNTLKDREQTRKNIEKIVNWTDKGLTLEEIIGKLNKEKFVKKDMIDELAAVCLYDYFEQARWGLGDTFNISIGQGDNAYTTLQMANYMVSLANGGAQNGVTLIAGKKKEEKNRKNPLLNVADAEYIIEAMTGVTGEPNGSLYGVFSSFPYSVAAKTGTAQRAGKKSVEDERGYLMRHLHLIAPDITMDEVEAEAARLEKAYPDIYDTDAAALRRAVINKSGNDITTEDIDRYKESYDSFAWTVALAPADDPKIAVAVMLVQGKTSYNAAPVVREIIGKYGEISRWEKSF